MLMDYITEDREPNYRDRKQSYQFLDDRFLTISYIAIEPPKVKVDLTSYAFKKRNISWEKHAYDQQSEAEFNFFTLKWKQETAAESSTTNIVGNLNYLRVIAMGERALPFIFRDLRKGPAPWFVALRAIVKDDTVDANTIGDYRKKGQVWLKWAEEHGYI